MVEKIKQFNTNPPGWYKTLVLTLLTAFVGSILAVLISMNSNIAGMDQKIQNQANLLSTQQSNFTKYVDNMEIRVSNIEDKVLYHDFEITELKKKVN